METTYLPLVINALLQLAAIGLGIFSVRLFRQSTKNTNTDPHFYLLLAILCAILGAT